MSLVQLTKDRSFGADVRSFQRHPDNSTDQPTLNSSSPRNSLPATSSDPSAHPSSSRKLAPATPPLPYASTPPASRSDSNQDMTVRRRFQQGGVDECSILGPELGPLSILLVGTESGSWGLSEVTVVSSRTQHSDRFVCQQMLGRGSDHAVYLTPVPPGLVVYGSGSSAVIVTKETAETMRLHSVQVYENNKIRVLGVTAALTLAGTTFAACSGGAAAALPFAIGGGTGVLYQWLLQQGVDSMLSFRDTRPEPMPKPSKTVQHPLAQRTAAETLSDARGEVRQFTAEAAVRAWQQFLASPFTRMGLVGLALSGVGAMSNGAGTSEPGLVGQLGAVAISSATANPAATAMAAAATAATLTYTPIAGWQFVLAVLGFMTQKVVLVGVSMVDADFGAGNDGAAGGGGGAPLKLFEKQS
ncbi:MAG: hypothetical protein WDW36_002068 [Sanguina aurantia]